MTIVVEESGTTSGYGTSFAFTPGVSVNDGDVVVVAVNVNYSDGSTWDCFTAPTGGAAWNESAGGDFVSGESAHWQLYHKVANGSEPSTYTVTSDITIDADWRICWKIISGDSLETDTAGDNFEYDTTADNYLVMGAANGQNISDGAISILAGGKDNNVSGTISSSGDNSYVSAVGGGSGRITGMCHRIFTSAQTPFANDVTVTGIAKNDKIYSSHIAYVEGAASPLTASGSVTTGAVTSSGVAKIIKKAQGTAALAAITAIGLAGIAHEASGAVSVENLTTTAAANQTYKASGAVSTEAIVTHDSGTSSASSWPVPVTISGQGDADGTYNIRIVWASWDNDSALLSVQPWYDGAVKDSGLAQTFNEELNYINVGNALTPSSPKAYGPYLAYYFDGSTYVDADFFASQAAADISQHNNLQAGTAFEGWFAVADPRATSNATVETVAASGTAVSIATLNTTGSPSTAVATASGTAVSIATLNTTGSPSTAVATASGTAASTTFKMANGTAVYSNAYADGTVVLAPKVWLNTTETLSGATEMTVTAWSDTSITFTDPVGSPTGSLFLGVENRNTGEVGWIAVDVTQADFVSGSGAPETETIVSSATASQTLKPSSAVALDTITASGTVKNALKAIGAPSLETVTASGLMSLQLSATGAPSLETVTASGLMSLQLSATGAPSLETVTASGSAVGNTTAYGAVSLEQIIISSAAVSNTGPRFATGTALLEEIASTGTITVNPEFSSGAVTTSVVTAASTALLAPKVYLNTSETLSGATEMDVTAWSDTSITFTDPVGAPTGSVFLAVENRNTGGIDWIAVNVDTPDNKVASGAVALTTVQPSGIINNFGGFPGTPTVEIITAEGTVTLAAVKVGSGTSTLEEITSSGVVKNIADITGAATIETITVSGNATRDAVLLPTGTATLEVITCSGAVKNIPSTTSATTTEVITANGQVIQTYVVSGNISIDEIETVGSVTVGAVLYADGAVSLGTIQAVGTDIDEGESIACSYSVIHCENRVSEVLCESTTSVVPYECYISTLPYTYRTTSVPCGSVASKQQTVPSETPAPPQNIIVTGAVTVPITASSLITQTQKPFGAAFAEVVTSNGFARQGKRAAAATAIESIVSSGIGTQFKRVSDNAPIVGPLTGAGVATTGPAIFIRSKGTLFTNYPGSALNNEPLPMPPDYEVGDLLVCAMLGFDRIEGDGTWTSMYPSGSNTSEFGYRVATGSSTSPDTDDIPETGIIGSSGIAALGAGQVIALASNLGSVEYIDRGTHNKDVNSADYELEQMGVGPNPTNTMVIGVYTKNRRLSVELTPTTMEEPIGDLTTIDRFFVTPAPFDPSDGFYYYAWCGWGYQFQETSEIAPFVDINHYPTSSLATYDTMYARFGVS